MEKARSRKIFRKVRQGNSDFALISESAEKIIPLPSSSLPEAHTQSSPSPEYLIFEADDISDYSDNNLSTQSNLSDSDSEQSNTESSASDLRGWALKHNITFSALGDLLEILNRHPNFDLPKDPRTLLCTPRSTTIEKVEPGEYVHFEWISSVEKLIQVPTADYIKIQINIDGIPLYKSSTRQFWPILAKIVEYNQVVVIGIYSGFGKPTNINNFLRQFVNEFNTIEQSSNLKLKISAIVCDVPARSFILGTKCHNGYSSCGKCDIKGEYLDNRVTFPPGNYNLRNNENFRSKLDTAHHNQASIIELLPIDLVEDVPVDFMHLVCLGVTRKLLFLWVKGKKCPGRLRPHQVDQLSTNLLKIKTSIPKEFSSKPRPIRDLEHWKATEYRQFILYTGPTVLKKILAPQFYQHFLCFHVAITILANPNTYLSKNNYAQELLIYFVNNFGELYGKKYNSHNLHNLLHLSRDCIRHGPLDQFSAFPFENKLQQIKRLVRSPSLPLQQVYRRLVEREKIDLSSFKQPVCQVSFFQVDINSPECFKVCKFANFELSNKLGNNFCKLKDGTIIKIHHFVRGSPSELFGQKFKKREDFFQSPCPSSLIGVQLISDLSAVRRFNINLIESKCVVLPFETEFICYPLIHSEIQ